MADIARPATPGTSVPTSGSGSESDWTDQVTDLVVDVVDRVHDSTTGPLLTLAKSVVVGLVAGIVGVTAIVLVTLLSVRALDLLPLDIWLPYLVLGVLLTAAGLFLWSKRHPVTES
jgi:H+/Cl- antiporter ClcA